jgi:hypothetical protein
MRRWSEGCRRTASAGSPARPGGNGMPLPDVFDEVLGG